MYNYFDLNNLSHLWDKIVNKIKSSINTEIDRAKSAESSLQTQINEHVHDERYYTESEVDTKLDEKAPLNSPSLTGTPVAPTAASGTNTTQIATTAFAQTEISAHNTSSTAHSDIRELISDLASRLNAIADSDDTTLDQFSEIVAYIKANRTLIESVTTNKVSVSDIIDNLTSTSTDKPLSANQGKILNDLISALQTAVDSKVSGVKGDAETSYRTGDVNITPTNIGLGNVPNVSTNDQTPTYTEATTLSPLSTGERLSVAFGKISKAITDLISHLSDTVSHITGAERINWDAAKTHADSAHAPSDAQANQNAFSNVVVGDTAITAGTTTDTLTLEAGSNVAITPDATNNKLVISAESGGVQNVGTGTSNGTISVDGEDVPVKGLGSAAYTNSNEYAATDHEHNYLPLEGGTMTGQIKKNGVGSNWILGRDKALTRMDSLSGYSAFASVKTTNGTWEIGAYDASGYIDDLVFTFCTDENYNNGTNTSTAQINFLENGTIAAGITGNAATASKLATARTIALTGDVTGSGTFDGSGNLSIETTSSSGGGSSMSQIKSFEPYTTVFNSDGSITETSSSGNVKKTVFNSNGTITETLLDSNGTQIEKKTTTFNSNGSITESIV